MLFVACLLLCCGVHLSPGKSECEYPLYFPRESIFTSSETLNWPDNNDVDFSSCVTKKNRGFNQKEAINMLCSFCGASFSRSFNLKVHMRRWHGIGHDMTCEICGRKFRSNISLSMCPIINVNTGR